MKYPDIVSMDFINSLESIISRYDALLLDLWGVVHDGSQLYPGVHETLVKLQQANKKIIMISNAPRRARKAVAVLTQLGVELELYDHVITSGELGYQWLKNRSPLGGARHEVAKRETWGVSSAPFTPHGSVCASGLTSPAPPPRGEQILLPWSSQRRRCAGWVGLQTC